MYIMKERKNEYIRTVLYTLMNERRCKIGKRR